MITPELEDKINSLSNEMLEIVNTIVQQYCQDLDDYMSIIDDKLLNSKSALPTSVIEEYILNLSSILYFVTSAQESLGIKEDVCKAIRKEAYNSARELASGTIADKDAAATLATQQEQLISDAYSRAYKKVKLRVDAGSEMLSSLKKVLTSRITEISLSNSKV